MGYAAGISGEPGGAMGIGVGGGIGPLRAGVGVSGNTAGAGCLAMFAFLLIFTTAYFIAAWPWWLGAWLAVKLGAGNPSTTRTVTAWAFEGTYLALALGIIIVSVYAIREARREAAARKDIAHLEGELAALERLRTSAGRTAEVMRRALSADEDSLDQGPITQAPCELLRPRVQYRGGPKVQSSLEEGLVFVDVDHVRFVGETQSEIWPLKRLLEVRIDGTRMLLPLSRRQTVSGISAQPLALQLIAVSIDWARAQRRQRTVAYERVQVILRDLDDARETLLNRIASNARPLDNDERDKARGPGASATKTGVPADGPHIGSATSATEAIEPVRPPDSLPRAKPDAQEVDARPEMPPGVHWGQNAERALRKIWPNVGGWLAEDESLVGAVRINKFRPLLGMVVVTSQRLLAIPPSPSPSRHAPVEIFLRDVKQINVSSGLANVEVETIDGGRQPLGHLLSKLDEPVLRHAIATAQSGPHSA